METGLWAGWRGAIDGASALGGCAADRAEAVAKDALENALAAIHTIQRALPQYFLDALVQRGFERLILVVQLIELQLFFPAFQHDFFHDLFEG